MPRFPTGSGRDRAPAGGGDDLADLGRELEERDDVLPGRLHWRRIAGRRCPCPVGTRHPRRCGAPSPRPGARGSAGPPTSWRLPPSRARKARPGRCSPPRHPARRVRTRPRTCCGLPADRGYPRLASPQVKPLRADESAGTPGSVPACGLPRVGGGHPSTTYVAARLQRPTRELGRAALERSLSGLAPGGVYRAAPVTRHAGGLLHHRFTLTAHCRSRHGGLFSVALSRGSPRVGVTHHRALRSPDVPRRGRTLDATAWPTHPQPGYPPSTTVGPCSCSCPRRRASRSRPGATR